MAHPHDLRRLHVRSQGSAGGGWLTVQRLSLRLERADGLVTPDFDADVGHRPGVDAVAVLPWFRAADGAVQVLLRSCLRPGFAWRSQLSVPHEPLSGDYPLLWELPAGIPEADERGEAGLRRAAARELAEETGLRYAPDRLEPLGAGFFPSAGLLAEQLWLYSAPLDAAPTLSPPEGDGGPFEAVGHARWWPLEGALQAMAAGRFEAGAWWRDAKTELALHRLRAHLRG